jgi:CBS domain-containing protein
MRDTLEKCGYPRCDGDYMASNPHWRKHLNVWRSYFRVWITEARFQSIQDALICFDMRPVAGDFSLFGVLEEDKLELLERAGLFKSVLAFVSIQAKPPLGFFRSLVVERTGKHKSELDLKLPGSGAIVSVARLLALDAGVKAQNTMDRLAALAQLPQLRE